MGTLIRLPPTIRYAAVILAIPLPTRPSHPRGLRFSTASSPSRTYADALALLDSLQSNRAIVSTISSTPRDMNLTAMPEMIEWTHKAGYQVEDFTRRGLRCVHVAGTKGKGSVCIMVENILLQYRKGDGGGCLGKIGLYTSPHLVTVRERIRIDGSPISEPLFTRYFFDLWDRFSQAAADALHPAPQSSHTKPGYFRYLTLMAFHAFIEEGVETAIIECGIGGEYDSTNILPAEAVTVGAITALGIDHTGMLGNTIQDIAWHKAGIMKEGVPIFTVDQVSDAQAILERRAMEKRVKLTVIRRLPQLDNGEIQLGMDGEFQKDNASLAIAVAASHLRTMGINTGVPALQEPTSQQKLLQKFVIGLETATSQGRWQVIKQGQIEWLIDGAHTADSLRATAEWYRNKFAQAVGGSTPPTATMLIFNQQDRDAKSLLRTFMTSLRQDPQFPSSQPNVKQYQTTKSSKSDLEGSQSSFVTGPYKAFTYVAFCTNEPFKAEKGQTRDLEKQEGMAELYQTLEGNALNMSFGSIEEAVEMAKRASENKGDRLLVLVTGSLHLVGGLLKVLEKQKNDKENMVD